MASEDIKSETERYYLQLKDDSTYILVAEEIYRDEYDGMEMMPNIIYSRGTYLKNQNSHYMLTPERGVSIGFEDKWQVKRKKVISYSYIEKEDFVSKGKYRVDTDLYCDESGNYYLAVEENSRIKNWLYNTQRKRLPATMEDFMSQYRFDEHNN